MSRVVDSGQPDGPGLFILQHHQSGVALEMRSFLAAVRRYGRESDGTYQVDKPGDLIGFYHWSPSFGGGGDVYSPDAVIDGVLGGGGGSRKIGAWSSVMPVVTTGGSGETSPIGTINGQPVRGAGAAVMADTPGGGRGRFASAGIVGGAIFVPLQGNVLANPPSGDGEDGTPNTPTGPRTGDVVGTELNFIPSGYAINSPFGIGGGGFFDIGANRPDNRFSGGINVAGLGVIFAGHFNRLQFRGPNSAVLPAANAAASWLGTAAPKARRILTLSRPVRGNSWNIDRRFALIQTGSPQGWPDFPLKFHGMMVQSSDEQLQRTYMHPTDPRLVAVHETEAHYASSLVCDLHPEDAPDLTRHARLSSAFMVVRGPSNSPDGGNYKNTHPGRGNALAWPLTLTKQKDVRGGYVMDYDATGTGGGGRTRGPTSGGGGTRVPITAGDRGTGTALGFGSGDTFGTGVDAVGSGPADGLSGSGTSTPPSGSGGVREALDAQVLTGADISTTDPTISDRGAAIRTFRSAPPRLKANLILACMSINDGGPFDVGGMNDPHRIGMDSDRNPINAVHFSTEALWRDRLFPNRDGPFMFEDKYEPGTNFVVPTEVHLAWDAGRGAFAWWTTNSVYMPGYDEPPYEYPEYPRDIPPTDTPRDEPRDNDPRRGPTSGGGGTRGIVGAAGPFQWHRGLALLQETAHSAITGRPQLMRHGEMDTRYLTKIGPVALLRHDTTTPQTIRMEAFGAQGGKSDGPYLRGATPGSTHTGAAPWVYTQKPGKSRAPGGTAPGGFVFLPPEIDLSDIDNLNLAPTDRTISRSLVVMGPGVELGFGVPELAGGGVRDGYVVRLDTSKNLEFVIQSSVGVDGLTALELLADGGIMAVNLKSGTDQADAGAAANELYVDTNDDNTVKRGT